MLVKRETLLIKRESTYNTDSSPAASDAIAVENVSWAFVGARSVERPIITSDLSPYKSLFGGTLRSVTFDVEVKGSGTAGTAPDIDAVLYACGMTVTNTASTSDVYTPDDPSNHESVTAYYYQDGLVYKLTGCFGTMSVTLNAGERIMLNVTLTGHSVAPIDATLVAASFTDTTVPEVVLGTTFTIGGYAAAINSFTFTDGNVISTPTSITASDGYSDIRISERKVTGSLDPEDIVVATQDWEGKFRSRTAQAVVFGPIGSAGNIVQIDMAAVNYTNQSQGDRDGLRTRNSDFEAMPSAIGANDEFTFTFT